MSEKNEWKPIPASLYDLILTGDLEALLWQLKGVREAEEVRMALYNVRQTILSSSAPGDAQDERQADDPLNIRFTKVSDCLPELVEYSSSYGGQWSSKWCAVITSDGHIGSGRLTVSTSEKDAIASGSASQVVWREGVGMPRVLAWATMDRIYAAALAAQVPQQGEA